MTVLTELNHASKTMTAPVIFAGLIPIMIGSGTGSEAMQGLLRRWTAACSPRRYYRYL
jgi:hypothetical protein